MKKFLLGECKYRRGGVDIDVLYSLKQKFPVTKYSGAVQYIIFSFYGFSSRLKKQTVVEKIILVDGTEMAKVLK
jgi:hypothetical protein